MDINAIFDFAELPPNENHKKGKIFLFWRLLMLGMGFNVDTDASSLATSGYPPVVPLFSRLHNTDIEFRKLRFTLTDVFISKHSKRPSSRTSLWFRWW